LTFLYPSATITIEIILCEVNEMEQIYTNTAKMLKAISDPKRLQIVDMLSCGELCACKILEAFHITQPTLSHDMKLLVEAGLVNDRREGKNIYYSLNTETMKGLQAVLDTLFSEKADCICKKMCNCDYE
jgi:ArsR family transcriptional regulator